MTENIVKKKSETTLYQYATQMSNLKNSGIDIFNCTYDEIDNFFTKNNYADSTMNGYISAILHTLSSVDETPKNIKLKKMLSDKAIKLRIVMTDKNIQKELSEKEKKNFVSWDSILKIYKKMKEYCEKTNDIKIYSDFVLISLYVLHPPRRIKDYAQMYVNDEVTVNLKEIINVQKIYDNDYAEKFAWISQKVFSVAYDQKEEEDDDSDNDDKTKNSYITLNDQKFFVFENYKLNKKYGKQVLQLNNEMGIVMEKYCNMKKLKNGDRLFAPNDYSTKPNQNKQNTYFVERIKTIFQNVISKSISATSLRHIYLINFVKTEMQPYVKSLVSLCMAHGQEQQDKYAKVGKLQNITDAQIKNGVSEYYEKKDKFDLYEQTGNEIKYLKLSLFNYLLDALERNVRDNKKVGYIYGIYANEKLIYVGSTTNSIEDRFIEHATKHLYESDEFHKYLIDNINTCSVKEIKKINVSSRFEMTLYEDYYIHLNSTIENGMNTKYNNNISILLFGNENYDKKMAGIMETVASYIKNRNMYFKFLNENSLTLNLFIDVDLNDKYWKKINDHFEYCDQNLLQPCVLKQKISSGCIIHEKQIYTQYQDCTCCNKSNQPMMWGIYCIYCEDKYIVFVRKGGIKKLLPEGAYFENLQLVKFMMDNKLDKCEIHALGYMRFENDDFCTTEYLNIVKKQKNDLIQEYLKNGFSMHETINVLNYMSICNTYNLHNCNHNVFDTIALAMQTIQKYNVKKAQTTMTCINKMAENILDNEEHKLIPNLDNTKKSILKKVDYDQPERWVEKESDEMAQPIFPKLHNKKSGRPSKYKTEDEKKQARNDAKKKWYREKGTEHVKQYNKNYHAKK